MIFIIMINNRYRCYNDSKIRYQLEDISQCLIDAFILRQMDKPLKHSLRTGIGNDISDLFTFTFPLDRILTSSRNCSPFRAAYLERNRDFEHAATIIFSSFLYFDASLSTKRKMVSQSIDKKVVGQRRTGEENVRA